MKDYSDYKVVDFLLDDGFVSWVRNKTNDEFWSGWVRNYPENLNEFYQAREICSKLRFENEEGLSDEKVRGLIESVKRGSRKEKKPQRQSVFPLKLPVWARIAASVAFIAGIWYASYFFVNQISLQNAAIRPAIERRINRSQEPMIVKLPDRSVVILKKGSEVVFTSDFKNKRTVFLSGEAFFEVVHDPGRPFCVYSDEIVTRVLGTSFTVRAFRNEKAFRITVCTGKVSVYSKKKTGHVVLINRPVLVQPNQEAVFSRQKNRLHLDKLETPMELSAEKADRNFTFKDAPFEEIIETINKAYHIHIAYSKELASCRITAKLSEEHLLEKIEFISRAVEARYEMKNGQISITGDGCH